MILYEMLQFLFQCKNYILPSLKLNFYQRHCTSMMFICVTRIIFQFYLIPILCLQIIFLKSLKVINLHFLKIISINPFLITLPNLSLQSSIMTDTNHFNHNKHHIIVNGHANKQRQEYEQLSYFIRRPSMIDVLKKKGISFFFPIQYETFDAINYGVDLIGKDRTGSGKTIAYSLPILERLRDMNLLNQKNARPKFLVVLPTRELAIQVRNQIQSLRITPNEIHIVAVYGGNPIGQQIDMIRRGADVIAATPGRLIDLLERKAIDLTELQSVCLDEADEMLKQGFQEDVQKIFEFINRNSPIKTQKLLFSATVPRWVQQLAYKFMNKQKKFVDLIRGSDVKTSTTIEHLCICNSKDKRNLSETLRNLIGIYAGAHGSLILFCETKREANDLFNTLELAQAKNLLHGDIPQYNREQTFRNFKSGRVKCLIATNVAARGLDIPSVDLIIQMQPPKKADDYVHRSGRTGRAGKSGACITFYNPRENYLMKQIEKMANIRFKNISEPKQIDIIKANTKEILDRIRGIDQGVSEYYEQAAKELITEMGPEKALALALAEIAGTRVRMQEFSMQTKSPGFLTYIFSTQGERISSKQLHEFLSCRIDRFSEQDVYHINLLSNKALVFDVKQNRRKKLQEVILDLEKQQNILQSIYRLRLVTSEDMLKNFQEDDEVEFTNEEYENAIYNKNQLEVITRGLSLDVDQDMLFRFFKNNGVKIIQIHLLRDDRGNSQGLAFILTLNSEEKAKALGMSQQFTLQNRTVIIEQPKPRR